MRRLIAPPEPGIYPGVPQDVYFSWDCCSRSQLDKLRRSGAHMTVRDDKETDALRVGRAAHMAVLEGELFSVRYGEKTQCAAFTGKDERGRNQGSILLESGQVVCKTHLREQPINSAIELLAPGEYAMCTAMRSKVASKIRASGLIAGHGEFELSIVWDEHVTIRLGGAKVVVKVRCKARIDRFTALDGGTMVDLKTTMDASEQAFTRSIFDYSYDMQGGFYMRGGRLSGLPARHYVIMACEKEPPFEVEVFRLLDASLDAGEQLAMVLLRKYARCQHTGVWGGYPDRVLDVALPDWGWAKRDEEIKALMQAEEEYA